MKAIRIFFRNIRDGFKSVGRNFSLSLASISCITITLLVVAVALIVASNIENMTKLVKEDFTIVTFLDLEVDEEKKEELTDSIKNIKNVESVDFKSKDSIANDMKETTPSLKNIIDSWDKDSNPLYDTLLVKVKDTEKISDTANAIKELDGVNDINYGKGMVESLLSMFNNIEKIMIIAMIALLLVTLFLIGNTIKITIFSRKREIEIMRLVGASNFSIKQPFVIEGFCLGILGSIIPVATVLYGYSSLYKHFNGEMFSQFFELIPPEPFIYIIAGIVLLLGCLVGMIGSYNSVRKYLKI